MGEMTLEQVRDWLRSSQALMKGYDDEASACYKERADVIDAHLATPAQTVDVEAVREVIADLRSSRNYSGLWSCDLADKLSQAIGDKT
jgi:hypothetical protein